MKQKTQKQFDPFSNLGEQIVNIAKAGAYDAISPRLGELQEENKTLKAANKELREALKPFADMFGELTEQKVQQGGIVYGYNKANLTVYDFLRASLVLNNSSNVS